MRKLDQWFDRMLLLAYTKLAGVRTAKSLESHCHNSNIYSRWTDYHSHAKVFFLQSDYFVSHIHNSLCHFLMFSGVVSFPIAYCYNVILTIFFVLLLKISASDVLLSLYPLLNGSYTVSSDPHNFLCDPHDYADEF